MEIIREYRPNVLKNEFKVTRKNLNRTFSQNKHIFVFGYGSLLHSLGWEGRHMTSQPKRHDLRECTLKNYRRGPFAISGASNFYGIVEHTNSIVNGIVTEILTIDDWIKLMLTEGVAGITEYVTYRVVDVTNDITWRKLPARSVVHAVVCRTSNNSIINQTLPYKSYYTETYNGIVRERSQRFVNDFLNLGGVRNEHEAWEVNSNQKTLEV